MGNHSFKKLYDKILRSTVLSNKKTGEMIELTSMDKLLYSWFWDRYCFWRSQDREFHDNQDSIAKATGVTDRTVRRWVKRMKGFGVLTVSTVGVGIGYNNKYIVADIMDESKWVLNGSDNTVLAQDVKPAILQRLTIDEEDLDSPF